MADSEFEEFRKSLDTFPSHLKTPSPFYTLVPDLTEDDYPSSKSDSSDQEDDPHQTRRQHRSPIIAQTTSYALGGSVNKSGITTALAIGLETPAPTAAAVNKSSDEDDDIGDGLLLRTAAAGGGGGGATGACNGHDDVGQPTMGLASNGGGSSHQTTTHMAATGQVERRRRKLPEIPKHRKSFVSQYTGHTSLADELAGGISPNNFPHNHHSNQTGVGGGGGTTAQRSMLAMKCSYLLDEDSSPDSERLTSLGDVDSGHSTAHSPTDFKSMSPTPTSMTPVAAKVASTAAPSSLLPPSTSSSMLSTAHVDDDDDDDDAEDRHGSAASRGGDDGSAALCSPFQPPAFGGIPFSQIEMLEATHRGLHKFVPRHRDEIEVEIGDSVYVQKEADDLWCEGVNLRTGRQGIFPSAYAVDLDYNDFDPTAPKAKRERYLLGYLGSVETLAHKGTGVVCQAVRKIVGEFGESPAGQLCILEISDQGLRMVDRSNKQMKKEPKKPCIDYFYSLKNVSFCAFHPRDHRYIGFITKHPTIQRFACHVFKGRESTRPVAEAVGRAFQHFYQKFIETAYPIEDIYIE